MNPETEQGRALFQELLWVHSVVRRDLETVRRLAGEVLDGLPGGAAQRRARRAPDERPAVAAQGQLPALLPLRPHAPQRRGRAAVPTLRETDSEIGPVVDKLEADHRRVSDDLDEVEAAAAQLTNGDSETARTRVADGLNVLAENLLAHLDFEEREAGPTLRRLERL